MAVIYNDKVCIYANELIMYDPKRKVGSEKGFLPRGTYDSKVNRKQIIIARRSIPNSPALVEFDSLEYTYSNYTSNITVIPMRMSNVPPPARLRGR